jgi:hypothetical protein
MSEREARLSQFFSGYFNQDWDIGGAKSWIDVVVQYVKESPRAQVLTLRDDLRSWLRETVSGQGLPAALGCDYDPSPDGIDEREWVRLLADFIDKQIAN